MNQNELIKQIREVCAVGGEALSLSVLCDSIGTMGLPEPLIVHEDATVRDCVALFRTSSAGGVCIVDEKGHLVGIFTERDCVVRVMDAGVLPDTPVVEVMTKDPQSQEPDATIAFALTLMSHGGFRHLPIVHDKTPIGMLSVKNVVDFLVKKIMSGMIDNLELAE